jgi:hypothetical protein
MDEFLRRWWHQFALVLLGAIVLWLAGYDLNDSVPIIEKPIQ